MSAAPAKTSKEIAEAANSAQHAAALALMAKYPPELRAVAYELFMVKKMSPPEISIQLEIPTPIVLAWSIEDKWLEKSQELAAEHQRIAEAKVRDLLLVERPKTIERHLRVAAKLEGQVEDVLNEMEKQKEQNPSAVADSRALERLGKTLSSSAQVSARAAGIYDQPENKEAGKNGNGGGSPIIIIGAGPRPSVEVKQVDGTSAKIEPTPENT